MALLPPESEVRQIIEAAVEHYHSALSARLDAFENRVGTLLLRREGSSGEAPSLLSAEPPTTADPSAPASPPPPHCDVLPSSAQRSRSTVACQPSSACGKKPKRKKRASVPSKPLHVDFEAPNTVRDDPEAPASDGASSKGGRSDPASPKASGAATSPRHLLHGGVEDNSQAPVSGEASVRSCAFERRHSEASLRTWVQPAVTQKRHPKDERCSLLVDEVYNQLDQTTLSHLWKIETGTVVLISLDAICAGWQVQAEASGSGSLPAARVCNTVISAAFVVELGARLFVRGKGFFQPPNNKWNIFDLVIILCALLGEILQHLSPGSPVLLAQVSLLRLLRMTRFLHVLRGLGTWEYCRELWPLLSTFHRVTRSLFWTLFLSVLIFYAFGVSLTAGIAQVCAEDVDRTGVQLCRAFGSIRASMWSLFQAVSGGLVWGDLFIAFDDVSPIHGLLLVLCVILVRFIVANMVTAIIVRIVHQVASSDLEDMMYESKEFQTAAAQHLRQMFHTMDKSREGSVSLEEFRLSMQDLRITTSLKVLNLYTDDVEGLFRLFDPHSTGMIEEHYFIQRCLSLMGHSHIVHTLAANLESPASSHQSPHENKDSHQDRPKKVALNASLSMVVVPLLTGSTPRGACRIVDVEHRALSLSELLDIRDIVVKRSPGHGWKDMQTQTLLTPQTTNLYHLNYYFIAPFTVEQIVLGGLSVAALSVGEELQQHDPAGMTLAVGKVSSLLADGRVVVEPGCGRFVKARPIVAGQGVTPLGCPDGVESQSACSYKELVATRQLKPLWFCSHWWGEPVLDFIACCEEHARLRRLPASEASYWICAYANCQHQLETELGEDPEHSSFRKAMRLSHGTLVLLDAKATAFTRIWCDFELFRTITDKKPLDIMTVYKSSPRLLADPHATLPRESSFAKTSREQDFPISLVKVGLRTKLQEGDSSVLADKQRILKSMAKANITAAEANSRLHGYLALALWPQAVKHGKVHDYKLPDILLQDDGRKDLQLSLACFEEVDDSHVQVLAKGLPLRIERIVISFKGCKQISDAGIAGFAHALKQRAEVVELNLNFVNCERISDAGLEALAQCLPASLQSIQLHFDMCGCISAKGVTALAQRITDLPGLRKFVATLSKTRVDKDFRSKSELCAYARSLCNPRQSHI